MRITVPGTGVPGTGNPARGGAVSPGARPQMSNHQIQEAENVVITTVSSSLARGVYPSPSVTDCSSPEHVNYPTLLLGELISVTDVCSKKDAAGL